MGSDATESSADKQLIEAAENGNLDLVCDLLNAGADPRASYGVAVNLAAANGHAAVVAHLIRQGVSAEDTLSQDLVEASGKGHVAIVELLLRHGRDPNVNSGEPILAAVIGRRLSTIKLLLSNGAAAGRGVSARGALYCAVLNGDDQIVDLLLRHGALIGNDFHDLFWAVGKSGSLPTLDLLISQFLIERSKSELPSGEGCHKCHFRSVLWQHWPGLFPEWARFHPNAACSEFPIRTAVGAAIRLNSARHVDQLLSTHHGLGRFCVGCEAISSIRLVRSDLERAEAICAAITSISRSDPKFRVIGKNWVLRMTALLFRKDWAEKDWGMVAEAWRRVRLLGEMLEMSMPDPPPWLTLASF